MRPTIIGQQMETICRPFGDLLTLILQDFPVYVETAPDRKQNVLQDQRNYETSVYNYLNRNWIMNCDVETCVRNAAIVAATTPNESFSEFVARLPRLDLSGTSAPVMDQQISLLTYLKDVKWDDFYVRVTFEFLVDSLICTFLNRLLLITENLSRESAMSIFEIVMQLWFPPAELPEFFNRVRLINGKSIAHSVHVLSKIIPDRVASVVIQRIPNPKDPISETSVQLYLEFFQWVVINDDSKLNYETLPDKFKTLEAIAKKAKPAGAIHGPAMSYFLNLMGYLLNAYEPYRELPFIFTLSEIAKKYTTEKGYAGGAYALRALLYTFTNHKRMKLKLDEYIAKYIDKKMTRTIAPFHVESFLYFARGHNYAAQCDLELTEENWKWHNEDRPLLQTIFDHIVKNSEIFDNCQVLLGDLLVQLACNDFPKFISECLPKLMEQQFSVNNLHAICHMARSILSTRSKFCEYANNGTDSGSLERLRQRLTVEANSVVSSLASGYQPDAVVAYFSVPFVTTFHLSTPRNVSHITAGAESKLKLAIHNLIQTSEAKGRPIDNPTKIKAKQKAKWTKVMIREFQELIFEATDKHEIQFCQVEKYVEDGCMACIALIPYLSFTMETVKCLPKLVFSTLTHVASLSLRVLQAVIHLNKQWLDSILMSLCSDVATHNEFLYVQIQAVQHVVQSGLFVHGTVSEPTRVKLFFTMLIGMCSHSSMIRRMVLDLAKDVDLLTKGEEPNLHRFLVSYHDEIERRVQASVISLGCYQADIDFEDLEPINYEVIVGSNHDFLYMFFLGAFGRIFAGSDLAYMSTQLLNDLLESLRADKRNFMFYINMLCLLAGLVTEDSKELIKAKEEEFQTQISCLNNKKVIGYIAFYGSLWPSVGMDLLEKWPMDRPFSIHVVSVMMRSYATSSDEYINFAQKKAREIINYFLKIGLFEPKITFRICEEEALLGNFDCRSGMNNLLLTLHHIYLQKFEQYGQRPHGVYPRKLHVVDNGEPQGDESTTFAFLFNMNCMPDRPELQITKTLASLVLDSFAQVYVVPSELFNVIRENLDWIASVSFNTLCRVLDNYYVDILPQYFQCAPQQHIYFKAIARQFVNCKTAAKYVRVWKECLEHDRSQSDKEFESKTFESTGTLLALAFFSLSLLDVAKRLDGFRVLFTMSMSTMLIRCPTVDISDLAESLICLKSVAASQHPELAENLLIRISTFLQKHFVFCSEQFISQAFKLVKLDKQNPEFISDVFFSAITPWLKNMRFNREEAGIVEDVEPKFTVFSTFSFFEQFVECVVSVPLNRAHVTMIDQILDQRSADETSTLAFFVLSLFRLQQKSEDNAKKCIAILTYCLSAHTKTIISVLMNYVSFKGWYYYQIQLNQIDIASNMDKFTNTFGGTGMDTLRRQVGDNNDSVALYDAMVAFTLRVLLAFSRSNKQSISRISWLVIFFCLVHYDRFEKKTSDLLKIIVACDPKIFHSFSSVFMSEHTMAGLASETENDATVELAKLTRAPMPIVAASIQHLSSLSDKQRRQLSHEALQWALGCGDITIAVRCAKIYEIFVLDADEATVNVIIRTIQIFASILSEKNCSVDHTCGDGNSLLAIEYLASLLRILGKAHKFLGGANEDAFWLACQCLRITEHAQMPIVCEALKFVITCVKNKRFLTKVSSFPDSTFDGFLTSILHMQHTPLSLSLSYELVIHLVLENPRLLFMESGSPRDLILLILPYVFTNQYNILTPTILSSIGNLLPKKSAMSELYSRFSSSANDFLCSVTSDLLEDITDTECLATVIGFYTNAVKVCPNMIPPILLVSTSILMSPKTESMTQAFGEIGFTAIRDNDVTHNTLALNFLSALNKRKGGITPHVPGRVTVKLPAFEIHGPIDVVSWAPPENGDVFEDIRYLPPLFITDRGYIGCRCQRPISRLVQVVKVQPLSAWSFSMFRAEALEIQADVTFAQTDVRPGHDYDILLNAFLDNAVVPDGYIPYSDQKSRSLEPARKKVDRRRPRPPGDTPVPSGLRRGDSAALEMVSVAAKDFMPKQSEIDAEGRELLAVFNLPSFFPANLK